MVPETARDDDADALDHAPCEADGSSNDDDDDCIPIDSTPDHKAVAVADDHTTDRDFDDIPDELDKCPDVPESSDDEDIDGCPEPMIPSTPSGSG